MIIVQLYYDGEQNMLEAKPETIGFWSWAQFEKHFNRLYRWGVKFWLESVGGEEEVYAGHGRTRQLAKLEACSYDECADHWSPDNLFHYCSTDRYCSTQSNKTFCSLINERLN